MRYLPCTVSWLTRSTLSCLWQQRTVVAFCCFLPEPWLRAPTRSSHLSMLFLPVCLSGTPQVVLGSDEAAGALASWPTLVARLFALMPTPALLDGAVSLAQVG